ncbi:hypothetical protein PAXRUDRAFT_164438 [Paxillus rubicundulus Ve08.2h10]|uniref:Uncharacterized protein n=1 Tax=Paxillus rubicundulus Ve08.2h10 TaxID=930991 RepID=A0A0D0CSA3_9AGAM|nr:hypothetical protein PAXRUDRAFT_164438 [Paxillus rubicundulus Ve08.2h10]
MGLVQHILQHVHYLESLGDDPLCDILLAHLPYSTAEHLQCTGLDVQILDVEYGEDIMTKLSSRCLTTSERCKWPNVISKEVVFGCIDHYCKGSQWTEPLICAICVQYQCDVKVTKTSSETGDVGLNILDLRDEFIIKKSIVQMMSTRFSFINDSLDGLMLDK